MTHIEIRGLKELQGELQRLNNIQWEAIANKNLVDMFNRAGSMTPVRKRKGGGGLRNSRRYTVKHGFASWVGTFGYGKEYAPHVEYGHRVVRNGKEVGYVVGKRYLQKNVEIQQRIYYNDLKKALRKE